MIIRNTETLREVVKDIKILKKSQKIDGNVNYYFTTVLAMSLYNPKVIFINPKFLVFEFEKYNNSLCTYSNSLCTLINTINDTLKNVTKSKYSELYDKNIYNIFSETETTFSIRCYLPNKNGKYFITCKDNLTFKLPTAHCNFNSIIVEIRNIWGKNGTYGFNVELKQVEY